MFVESAVECFVGQMVFVKIVVGATGVGGREGLWGILGERQYPFFEVVRHFSFTAGPGLLRVVDKVG